MVGPCVRRFIVAGACVLGGACLATAQDSVASFYKGKQISIVVGSSAGGGYDTYARLLARHFDTHIPGHPTIVAQNMTGAGSNRAAAYIYTVAPKDGTAIGAIFPGVVLQPLLSNAKVQHDPSKFIYLGNANSDIYVCFVRSDAPVKKFQDVLTKELIVGASNPGATTYDLPTLLEQCARHQVSHRHRLCRQPRDHARSGARRGPRRLRHRLDRHRDHASATGSPRTASACWCS